MLFCAHRINTISELNEIPRKYGIEIDLRDNLSGEIYLAHDPFIEGENFEFFLKNYKHRFIILNVKSERIEYKIRDLLEKYNIKDYFFLDSSFPMIVKLSNEGEKKIAVRLSEYESIETVIKMSGRVEWVWIDCFSRIPINYDTYVILKNHGFKLCFVSPELQQQSEKINEYREYFKKNNIELDMICSKIYNESIWLEK